jgi:hypothetical protein
MFALSHNPDLRKQMLKMGWNEYRYTKNELEDILTSAELSEAKTRLLLALMKSCSWYELLSILTEKEFQQV